MLNKTSRIKDIVSKLDVINRFHAHLVVKRQDQEKVDLQHNPNQAYTVQYNGSGIYR